MAASGGTATTTMVTTVRFYFVRHGETIANRDHIVVGQWDSPLSDRGKAQADALGRSSTIRSTAFWRRYSSDLGRAQETMARLLLPLSNDDDDDDNNNDGNDKFLLDARIREIAKGARQEYPKSWTYERAVQERRQQRTGGKNETEEMPLLETTDEAWRRLADFVANVLQDANREFGAAAAASAAATSSMPTVTAANVLVVSHAGALRTLFQKMVPHAHPILVQQQQQEEKDNGGNGMDDPSRLHAPPDDSKRLQVPNTSVTILEVTPKFPFWEEEEEEVEGEPTTTTTTTTTASTSTRRRKGWNSSNNEDNHHKDDDAYFFSIPTTAGIAGITTRKEQTLRVDKNKLQQQQQQQNGQEDELLSLWDTKVVQFLGTQHLQEDDNATADLLTSNDE